MSRYPGVLQTHNQAVKRTAKIILNLLKKLMKEDTLLKAMELARNEALEKGAEVEQKGLDTQATKASIIETDKIAAAQRICGS